MSFEKVEVTKMKTNKLLLMGIVTLLIASLNLSSTSAFEPGPIYPPPLETHHIYRYLTDTASYDHEVDTYYGADAAATHGDIDDLGLKATSNLFQYSSAKTIIDGGYNDENTWELPPNQKFYPRVKWIFSGVFDYANGMNQFKFSYRIYSNDFEHKFVIFTKTVTYTSDRSFDNTPIYHTLGEFNSLNYYDTPYFLEVTISLSNYAFESTIGNVERSASLKRSAFNLKT